MNFNYGSKKGSELKEFLVPRKSSKEIDIVGTIMTEIIDQKDCPK
jgi:hypothetical protein